MQLRQTNLKLSMGSYYLKMIFGSKPYKVIYLFSILPSQMHTSPKLFLKLQLKLPSLHAIEYFHHHSASQLVTLILIFLLANVILLFYFVCKIFFTVLSK
jgi:hypothetical protein